MTGKVQDHWKGKKPCETNRLLLQAYVLFQQAKSDNTVQNITEVMLYSAKSNGLEMSREELSTYPRCDANAEQ
jgi:hypothetical protein